MKLLEYEAKAILHKYGMPIPASWSINDAQDAEGLAQLEAQGFPVVLKVQIPTGGRGKAGGVVRVSSRDEYVARATELLQKPILGYRAKTLLVEEALSRSRELYIAIMVDREIGALVLLAHHNGGVEIEQAVSPDDPMIRIVLHRAPDRSVVERIQSYYDLADGSSAYLEALLTGLYDLCVREDALLVEVNPLMVLDDGRLVCADAKMELDDVAAFRHPEWQFEAAPASSQFVELDPQGSVASMANGAGLAMATVDAIKTAGAVPANFFDVGGGTNVDGMVKAFERITSMPNVQAIVVNIFGGITRCDEVAQAIIEARRVCRDLPQLYIRLTGTNEAQGRQLLEAAGIAYYPTLADCVREAVS